MAQKIEMKNFVEIDYVGKLKNENVIFDTTEEKVARENGFYRPNVKYGSVVTCVGAGLILDGLDKSLVGKEIGSKYNVEMNASDSFGKKQSALIKLVPLSTFKKHNINPVIGLQVTFDNSFGVVKSISSGRVIVDFNHPLAGKDLTYSVKINKFVDDKEEQIRSLLELKLNIKKSDISIELDDDKKNAKVKLINVPLPEDSLKIISDFIKEFVNLNSIEILIKKSESK